MFSTSQTRTFLNEFYGGCINHGKIFAISRFWPVTLRNRAQFLVRKCCFCRLASGLCLAREFFHWKIKHIFDSIEGKSSQMMCWSVEEHDCRLHVASKIWQNINKNVNFMY